MTEQQLLLGEHMELSEQHIHQHRERQAAPGSGGGGLAIPLPHKAGERDGLNGALLCSTNVCVQPPPAPLAAAAIAVLRQLELLKAQRKRTDPLAGLKLPAVARPSPRWWRRSLPRSRREM